MHGDSPNGREGGGKSPTWEDQVCSLGILVSISSQNGCAEGQPVWYSAANYTVKALHQGKLSTDFTDTRSQSGSTTCENGSSLSWEHQVLPKRKVRSRKVPRTSPTFLIWECLSLIHSLARSIPSKIPLPSLPPSPSFLPCPFLVPSNTLSLSLLPSFLILILKAHVACTRPI